MTIDNWQFLEASLHEGIRKERKMRKEVENIMIDNQFNIVYSSGGPFHCQLSFIDCQLTKDPQGARTL